MKEKILFALIIAIAILTILGICGEAMAQVSGNVQMIYRPAPYRPGNYGRSGSGFVLGPVGLNINLGGGSRGCAGGGCGVPRGGNYGGSPYYSQPVNYSQPRPVSYAQPRYSQQPVYSSGQQYCQQPVYRQSSQPGGVVCVETVTTTTRYIYQGNGGASYQGNCATGSYPQGGSYREAYNGSVPCSQPSYQQPQYQQSQPVYQSSGYSGYPGNGGYQQVSGRSSSAQYLDGFLNHYFSAPWPGQNMGRSNRCYGQQRPYNSGQMRRY